MILAANIIGIAAVVMFVLSYQFKTRNSIIFINAASRVFYVLQYIMLGAFEGAIMDIAAFLVSLFARHKDKEWIQKRSAAAVVLSEVFVIVTGLLFYENIFSLLPIIGVLFETGALWLNKERSIRFVSFFGAPFWLVYNLVSAAYGSAAGNIITMVSIGIAIIRYDVLRREK